MNAAARKIETTEAWAERANALCKMINDLRPNALEPFSAVLSAKQMTTLRALEGAGWLHRCVETGRYFAPRAA